MNFVADPSLTAQIAAAGSIFSLLTGLSTEDLPLVIGYPPSCTDFHCGVKYKGSLDTEAIAAFTADSLLHLPQVEVLLYRILSAQVADRALALVFKLLTAYMEYHAGDAY